MKGRRQQSYDEWGENKATDEGLGEILKHPGGEDKQGRKGRMGGCGWNLGLHS